MNVTEAMHDAIYARLAENRHQLFSYDNTFARASAIIRSWGEQSLDEYRKLPGEAVKVLMQHASSEMEKLRAGLTEKSLLVDIVMNTQNGVELLLPVSHIPQTRLEDAVLDHALTTMLTFDQNAKVKKVRCYANITGAGKDGETLQQLLEEVPQAMRAANISIIVTKIAIPCDERQTKEARFVDVVLMPSHIQYGLIPVHRENIRFFPPYKREFSLITPGGEEVPVWVSSAIEPQQTGWASGNYVCGSRREGQLKELYKQQNLQTGDLVRVTEISPRIVYTLEILGKR